MFYVAANFTQLGGDERSRCNRANDAKAFFEANPNYPSSGNFTAESIRRCVFHLAPEKERPKLEGDKKLTHGPNQWNFINDFNKFHQQISKGLIPRPSVEDAQRQLAPSLDVMLDLAGREWVMERARAKV
jgi:hypothetical protein